MAPTIVTVVELAPQEEPLAARAHHCDARGEGRRDALGHRHRRQRRAAMEGVIADLRDARGDRHRRQRRAAKEGAHADLRDALGDRHRRQRPVPLERPRRHLCLALAQRARGEQHVHWRLALAADAPAHLGDLTARLAKAVHSAERAPI